MAKGRIAVNVEYLALRLTCAIINSIPYPLAMSMAKALGWICFNVIGLKRKRTLERIRLVFPDITKTEAKRIATKSIQNIFQTGVEMMRAPNLDRKWMDRYVKDGQIYKDKLQAYVDEGKGVVIMVPHSGNWYMAAWSMANYGLPLCAIAARQRNPKLTAWMNRQYGNIEVLDRDNRSTLSQIRERITSGRAFAILPDLRVREKDVDAEFLGGHANVSRSGAAFAVRCGCPIVVAAMNRVDGRHVFNHIATLRPDPTATDIKEESRRLTREAMKLLSRAVMQSPGDWFWYNKRWILEPV